MADAVLARNSQIVIDVWSDVMCPFCYLGDTLLTQALDDFPHQDDVTVRHHSYLLMPDVPAGEVVGLDEHLVVQRGVPRAQAEAANAQLVARAKSLGLDFRTDRVIVTQTRAAHRLSHYAATQGRQREMVRRLFKAYFTDGLDVNDHAVLAGLAGDIGLDPHEAMDVLESDAFERELEVDLRQAGDLSITGVPFFVFQGKYGVSGAQSSEVFRRVLNTTWDEVSATEPQPRTPQ